MSPAPQRADRWRDLATTTLAATLLALFWWLAVSASFEKSQTSDELPHIGAGYMYDRFSDFRMQPENGNLPQRLFGLPALAERARFPLDEERWRLSCFWELSWDFFYFENNLTDWLLLCARALNATLGVALGAVIFGLARAWHGRLGGLLALGFYALAPNFLAHAGLATSDIAGTLFLTIAPWLFWRHLQRRDLPSGLLAGLATGLALVSKFNGILLGPIYLVLVIAEACLACRTNLSLQSLPSPTSLPLFPRACRNFLLALLQAVAAVALIWLCYEFRFSARGPGTTELVQFAATWEELLVRLGQKRVLIESALQWKLLPESWLYGLSHSLAGATQRSAFLAGEYSLHGWWYFFPTLFLAKTTLGLLAAFVLVLILVILRCRRAQSAVFHRWVHRYLPLTIAAGVTWLAALTSNINIGDRHILPVYPVLFIALGFLAHRRIFTALAAVCLIVHVSASMTVRPHYLASFNALAGGPSRAYRLVTDSSLDWGQDLPALQKWLARHRGPQEPFYLGYFGNAWPPHYGVRPTALFTSSAFWVKLPLPRDPWRPGVYALSATVLAETYSAYRGPWSEQREQEFQALRARFELPAADPRWAGRQDSPDHVKFNALRLARLCKYLQRRTPDDFAGYSILIFRLTAEDLRAALDGPVVSIHRIRLP